MEEQEYILFYGKFLCLGVQLQRTAFQLLLLGKKIKDGLLSDLTKLKWLADWALIPLLHFSEIFAMQITVQDSFGYTNIYVCHAK